MNCIDSAFRRTGAAVTVMHQGLFLYLIVKEPEAPKFLTSV